MSNIATLKPIQKGDGRGGRVPGQVNRITRALKTALIFAAEELKHSKDKSLKSYCTFLADERPELFAGLFGKIDSGAGASEDRPARIDFEKLKLNMDMPLERG